MRERTPYDITCAKEVSATTCAPELQAEAFILPQFGCYFTYCYGTAAGAKSLIPNNALF